MSTFDTGYVRGRYTVRAELRQGFVPRLPSLVTFASLGYLKLNPYAISFKISLKLLSLPFEVSNDLDIHDPNNTTI